MNLTACKLKQYIAAMLKKRGVPLTPEQFILIDLLWNFGATSQQKLADMMQKDKDSVTKLVDAIERKGFVVRQQSSLDRRSNIIFLTEKAELLKSSAKQNGIYILDRMLDGISEEELRDFLSTLSKLNHNMSVSEQE